MKSSQDLISIIKNKPHLKKLQSFGVLEKLKLFLPLEMRKAILYITYQNNKLLFAFKHPSFVNEFNHYNCTDIRESLKTYPDLFPNFSDDLNIQAFVPRNILHHYTESTIIEDIKYYTEHSKGDFKNLAHNPKLKEQFEIIREIILTKQMQHQ